MFIKINRINAGIIAAALLASFAAGYGLRALVHDHADDHDSEIRLGGYRFINPLLECEPSSISGSFREGHQFSSIIRREVDSRLARKDVSVIAVYFRDLENGPWFGVNEKETFTPSSLLKVPLMMSILKAAESDPTLLRKKIKYDGREDITRQQFFKPPEGLKPGTSYSVDDLIFRMIAYSDNNATRLLAGNDGLPRVGDVMAELGIPFDARHTEECITVKDYSSFFRVLYNASYLNHDMSEKALTYLSRSSFGEGIRAGLPPHASVASKFGEFSSIRNGVTEYQLNEIGIVYHPRHPYLLGIVTKGTNHDILPHVIQDISALIYSEVDRQRE